MAKKLTIGIDVGGTNIKFGLVNPAGKIVDTHRIKTQGNTKTKKTLINAIVSAIFELIERNNIVKKDVTGIGIGLPGLIDSQKGNVIFLPNIPGWKNVSLASIIRQKTSIKCFLDNDVNLITLGEWKFGIGKGCKNLVYVALGTGVGSGLILNNSLYRGEDFVAGELGHMPLNEKGPKCNCGGFGCIECYVGNQYLLLKAGKIFKNKNIQLEDVFYLANQGNVRAVQFWEECATHIGNGLVGVVNLLNPRLIIIGGGVSNTYKYLGKTIVKIIKARAMKVQASAVKVVRAKLGDNAGILGANALVRDMT